MRIRPVAPFKNVARLVARSCHVNHLAGPVSLAVDRHHRQSETFPAFRSFHPLRSMWNAALKRRRDQREGEDVIGSYLYVVGLALMPALGNFAGGVVAEVVTTSPRMLSRALHAAAGIVVGVVAIELMPEALGGGAPPWAIILGLCLGGGFYAVLDWGVERLQGGDKDAAGPWMIYAAVAVDLFSDGLMIGVGSVVSIGLALVLALGQVMADVPEGFATIVTFKDKGQSRKRRLLLSASFLAPCLAGASLGYWLLRDATETLKLSALAFTAGILLIAAVEDMLQEAHESAADTRYSALFFIGGFALFTAVGTYFGD